MLLKLPHEIIIQIARKLNISDKLNLMLTCQVLTNLISNRCLYEKLVMIQDQERSEMIVEKFRSKQLDGCQVKELFYHLTLLSDDLFAELPSIFPNVTKAIDISNKLSKETRSHAPIEQLKKWVDTLESYSVTNDWYKMARHMQTMTFPRLTYLYLSCSTDHKWKGNSGNEDVKRKVRFYDCLDHVPALTSLHLHHAVITLSTLEKIHSNCAQLRSFNIEESLYLIDDEPFPLSITPAKSITRLAITSVTSFCDTRSVFMDYIIAKYTNLKDFIFYPLMADDTYVLRNCYPDDFEIDSEVGSSKMVALVEKIKKTHELYRKETASFLSRLPETIKGRFEFNADMFDDVPESLELTKARPIDLVIQQRNHNPSAFTKPGQLGCLTGLTSVKNLELQVAPSLEIYENEIASNSVINILMFLTQEGQYKDVNFGRFLSAFPLVEEFASYSRRNGYFIETSVQEQIHLNLRKLSLTIPTVDPNFLPRLSKQAPNIKELKLHLADEDVLRDMKEEPEHTEQNTMSTRLVSAKIDYTLDLTGFNLDLFEFKLASTYEKYRNVFTRNDIYYKVKIRDITKRLVCIGSSGVIPAFEYDGIKENLPRVTILGDKFKQISVNNCGSYDIIQDENGSISTKEVDILQKYPIVIAYHFPE